MKKMSMKKFLIIVICVVVGMVALYALNEFEPTTEQDIMDNSR